MQSNIQASGGKITGTLIKQTSGQIVTDWGEGYFIGLKFTPDSDATVCKVGLSPSAGTGLLPLDEDCLAMLKLTDKNTQKLKVVQSRAGEEKEWLFDLSSLVLN